LIEMKTAYPSHCYPDTNVVIGRARKMDVRHRAVVQALAFRALADIKVLRTVYVESINVVSKKNQRALREIQAEMLLVASTNGISPQIFSESHMDQILKIARSNVDKDVLTYFESIELLIKTMMKQGLDPFTTMGYVGDCATQQDRRSIGDVFLTDSVDDCVGCVDGRQLNLMREAESLLKSSSSFFDDKLNSRDREIAAEAMVVAWDIETSRRSLFLTDDNNFYDALYNSIKIVAAKKGFDPERFSVKKVL